MSDTKDSSDDDDNENDQSEEEDNDLIPPFVPNQTIFTCHVEQPRSPKSSASYVPQVQAQKTERFFEAVIRQARHHPSDSTWSFKIHFKGWNARYDMWLPASQLLEDTPETREKYEKQQQLEKSQRQAEIEAQKQEQARKQQRKKEQQQQLAKATAELTGATLPFTLKTVLVDEREKIMRLGYDAPYGYDLDMKPPSDAASVPTTSAREPARSVHALPSSVTIRQLLKHFEKRKRKEWQQKQEKKSSPDNETEEEREARITAASNQFKQEIRQFCKGLGRLFETALPVCLLYAPERPQYEYYSAKHQSVLDVYGCEFLLRLLLRLPQLMGKAPPQLVGDLTVLLQQNRQACFKGNFRPPTYPHEWLGWEKKFFGDPNKETEAERKDEDVAKAKDSSDEEDLFQ